MVGLEFILKQIEEKLMQNLSIAVLAIAFWMIQAEGMTTANLHSVMTTLGFTFDETEETLTADGTTYTIYQLLEYCVYNLFPTIKVLYMSIMECIISKAENMEYITSTEAAFLLSELPNQEVI